MDILLFRQAFYPFQATVEASQSIRPLVILYSLFVIAQCFIVLAELFVEFSKEFDEIFRAKRYLAPQEIDDELKFFKFLRFETVCFQVLIEK